MEHRAVGWVASSMLGRIKWIASTAAIVILASLPAINASAAIARAEFTAVIDEAWVGSAAGLPNCDPSASSCEWTDLIGQEAHGQFWWDPNTDFWEFGAPDRYRGGYSVTVPGISSQPMPVWFWEGGLRLSPFGWLVGGRDGDLQSVRSSLSIVPGGSADGTFTPGIENTLFTFSVVGGNYPYHCPFISTQGHWVQCWGSGHLTSLSVYLVEEPGTLPLAVAALLLVLVAPPKKRTKRV